MKNKAGTIIVILAIMGAIGMFLPDSENPASTMQEETTVNTKSDDQIKSLSIGRKTTTEIPIEQEPEITNIPSATPPTTEPPPTEEVFEYDELQKLYLQINSSMAYDEVLKLIEDSELPYDTLTHNQEKIIRAAHTISAAKTKYGDDNEDFIEVTFIYAEDKTYNYGTCIYTRTGELEKGNTARYDLIEYFSGDYWLLSKRDPGLYIDKTEILKRNQNFPKDGTKEDQLNFLLRILPNEEFNIDINSELDIDKILNSPNLPQYYGSLKAANELSKSFAEDIFLVDISFKPYAEGKTILYIGGYSDEDSIRDIELYPKNSGKKMTVKEVYSHIDKFLPTDILAEFYDEPTYERYIPKDKTNESYIVINYSLSSDGKESYYNKEITYQGAVTVIFREKDNLCEYMSIGFGTPRQMSSAGKNRYSIEPLDSTLTAISKATVPPATDSPTEAPPPETTPATIAATDAPAKAVENNFNKYDISEQQNTTSYVLNTSSKKFHESSCSDVKKIKPENYSTIASAVSNGYDPCKKCSP